MPKKKHRRLWQMINGEPYIVDGEVDTSWKGTWFFPKIIDADQVWLSNPPMPLTIASLRKLAKEKKACLNTDEVAELRDCSRLTIIRHVASGQLTPISRSKHKSKGRRRTGGGKGFLFRAEEVLRWMAANPIAVGRPRTKKASVRRRG